MSRSARNKNDTILILEDNPSDVELILAELRRSGYTPDSKVLCTKEEYLAALNEPPDVILSDYTMPQFDAPTALALLKERSMDIPFIVISGTVGEDTAVAMMRNGATDYLLKDRLSRLSIAIDNALMQKELRRQNAVAAESLKKMMRAVEQSADSIVVTDDRGVIEYVNPAFLKTTKYTMDEVIGKTPALLKSGHHSAQFYAHMWKTLLSGKIFRAEFVNRKKNGELFYEVQGISPVFDDNGKIINYVSTGKDISERKQAEIVLMESERRFREMLENVELISMTLDKNGYVSFCNDYLLRLTGWKRGEVIGADWFEKFIPDSHTEVRQMFFDNIAVGTIPAHQQNPIKTKNGDLRDIIWSNTVLKDVAGNVIGTASIGEDMTEYHRAEEIIKHSELQYRTLVEAMNEGVLQVDNDDVIQFVNDSYCRMVGYSREELIGKVAFELLLIDEDREFIKNKNRQRQKGTADSYAVRMRIKSGEIRWFEISGAPIYDPSGVVIGSIGIHTDITEQKKTVESLKLFRALIDRTNDAVEVIDPATGRFIDMNERECIDLGYSREEMLAMSIFDIDPNIRRENFEQDTAAERNAGLTVIESVHKRKDGSQFPVEVTVNYIQLDKEYIVAVVRNITERKQVERRNELISNLGYRLSSVETSEQAAQIVMDVADQLFGWDACTVDLYLPQTDRLSTVLVMDIIDGKRAKVPPTTTNEVPSDTTRKVLTEGPVLILRDISVDTNPSTLRFGDTSRISASLLFVPIRQSGKSIGIISIQSYTQNKYNQNDVTTLQGMADQCGAAFMRIQTLEALRQSEERYRTLIDSAVDAIFTLSNDGIFTSLNPAFEKITGWQRDRWLGEKFTDILHEEDRILAVKNFQSGIQGEDNPVREYRIRTAGGSFVVVEVLTAPQYIGGKIAGLFGVARDVTERLRLEGQIRQAQKMESIGTLAGGIAHDFNNILGIILASATLLERIDRSHKNFKSTMETINRTVQRGAMLVRQILTFARKNDIQVASVQINDVIVELTKMLELTIPKTIEIKLHLDAALPNINVDSNQVHQALLNLCVNARDAILDRRSDGTQSGTITISTVKTAKKDLAEQFQNLSADDYLVIRVSDTGIGMDDETKQRIFDPFFTTKEIGKGTGLGLAVVYGVMQSQHGFVGVDSMLGKGTTFSLYFPVSEPMRNETAIGTETVNESKGGSESILVIEDEESLLELIKQMLETKGYVVHTAMTGPEGVETFIRHKDEIVLIFTDFGLPGLDGYSMLKQIKEIKQNIKMLMASGYLEPQQRSEAFQLGVYEIIQKPYEPSFILSKVREVLDR